MIEKKKPFGLALSCKLAAEAIRESVAPNSVVLYNLLVLQNETVFPKNLDTHFFATSRKFVPEDHKRLVTKILDKMHFPHLDTALLLEEFVKNDWVIKKAPPKPVAEDFKSGKSFKSSQANLGSKTGKNTQKNTQTPKVKTIKTSVKKEVVAPVVIVKKHRVI